ncbi:hypothetical protein GCM10023215_31570 [Pseudonocardia yuanmonensis]|uniref:ATP-dependent DNA ligase family profile domain-containing protein n=1 Tax=Pseudonocardia yuanmonensis TaxID=1095914 RepID=A0ABP8WMV9_9PSEU
MQSRRLRSLTRHFPEIVAAVAELGEDVVLDGQLVVWRQGRLDILALQERLPPSTTGAARLAAAKPAAYVVFELLACQGTDLRPIPRIQRRRRLEELLGLRLLHGLVLMPTSGEATVGRLWMREHDSGTEGVVAKRVDQTYRAGARVWRKVKTRLTAEAVVGGVLGFLGEPDALVVCRYGAHGRLRSPAATLLTMRRRWCRLGVLLPDAGVDLGDAGADVEDAVVEVEAVRAQGAELAAAGAGSHGEPGEHPRVRVLDSGVGGFGSGASWDGASA